MPDREKEMASFRLSAKAREYLDVLARHHGIDRTAVIEQEIRRAARRDLPKKVSGKVVKAS